MGNSDTTSYTAAEVDQKLAQMKEDLLKQIDDTIVMNKNGSAPSASNTSLWLKVTKTD